MKPINLILPEGDIGFQDAIREASKDLSITFDANGRSVVMKRQGEGIAITWGEIIQIHFGHKVEAFRALGLLAERLATGDEKLIQQNSCFDLNAFMLDCSRNAVLKPENVKKLIRKLALMGFNAIMLYTEDTVSIPSYPYFGYMRGTYSADEIRDIDDYSSRFGIELIPCIQTLSHFTAPMRWPFFKSLRDIDDILLIDYEETYQFLDSLIGYMGANFRSRRIHVGLDEAHMAGLGRYLDEHGQTDKISLIMRHVRKVYEICEKRGFCPMMWSDTLYSVCGGSYNNDKVTDAIYAELPKRMQLVMWDYYTGQREAYDRIFESHHRFDRKIIFAGGAWKWLGFAPHIQFSFDRSRKALESCISENVRDILLTAWGDDGSKASVWSILPVMQYFAEFAYANDINDLRLKERFYTCTGGILEDFIAVDALHLWGGEARNAPGPVNPDKYMLYQDLLIGLFDANIPEGIYPDQFAKARMNMSIAVQRNPEYASFFYTLENLAAVLEIKCDLGVRFRKAYQRKDSMALSNVLEDLQHLGPRLEALYKSVCRQWDEENKPFGREILDARFGTLAYRLQTAEDKLRVYLAGECSSIPELEVELLPYDGMEDCFGQLVQESAWLKVFTAGVMQK